MSRRYAVRWGRLAEALALTASAGGLIFALLFLR